MNASVIIPLLFVGLVHAQAPERRSCSSEGFKKVSSASLYIVVATVDRVFSPPGYWSGTFAAMQVVQYKPVTYIKGHISKSSFVASHYVVSGSRTADIEKPQLSPELFKPGRKLVLFLSNGPGQFWQEASGCKTLANSLCAMVGDSDEHKALAKEAQTDPLPDYSVKDENCGVLAVEDWNRLSPRRRLAIN